MNVHVSANQRFFFHTVCFYSRWEFFWLEQISTCFLTKLRVDNVWPTQETRQTRYTGLWKQDCGSIFPCNALVRYNKKKMIQSAPLTYQEFSFSLILGHRSWILIGLAMLHPGH